MGFFKSIGRIFKSQSHELISKIEDPIKLIAEGIRELKKKLELALNAYAETKALQIKANRDVKANKELVGVWGNKAIGLLQSAKDGKIDEKEATRLATAALQKQNDYKKNLQLSETLVGSRIDSVKKVEQTIATLKEEIKKYERELAELTARQKAAAVSKEVNKQIAQIDFNDTISMMEEMKRRVESEEVLALAYEEMGQQTQAKTLEDEIDNVLQIGDSEVESELEKLKKQIGMDTETVEEAA